MNHPGTELTRTIAIGSYQVAAPLDYGPRVVALSRGAGPSLFARLDDTVSIQVPGLPPYHFRGGHRIWAAPEEPQITYAPDDHPCEVVVDDDALTITAAADSAGLTKQIRVWGEGDRLVVEHTIGNAGSTTIRVAPWAITQFCLGGVALMPLIPPGADRAQADRSLVLWPYTDLADRRIGWGRQVITLSADPGPKLKLGLGPRPERLGYLAEGQLFVKEIPRQTGDDYPDRGAVGQVFLNEHFCELESVGAITSLKPGATVTHREIWSLQTCPDLDDAEDQLLAGS